jgi:hypothetical protein
MRTSDGCLTFTLCKDKKACEKSVSVAREWVQKNAENIGNPTPKITEGPVAMRITA